MSPYISTEINASPKNIAPEEKKTRSRRRFSSPLLLNLTPFDNNGLLPVPAPPLPSAVLLPSSSPLHPHRCCHPPQILALVAIADDCRPESGGDPNSYGYLPDVRPRDSMDRLPVEEQVKRVDAAPNPSSMTVISCFPVRARAFYRAGMAGSPSPSSWFEIRLFYVRISPFTADVAPESLILSHLRRESGVVLEINGSRVPPSEPTSVVLRRDRVDRGAAEVTYVSTDNVRLTGAVDFEVYHGKELLLCGSLERMETPWSNGVEQQHPTPQTASVKDPKTGWCMNCYLAESPSVQRKLSTMPPSIEVYVAGCSSGYPLILVQTIQHSPRRKKILIHGVLDAIPEDDETCGKEYGTAGRHLTLQRLSMVEEDETDEVETTMKDGRSLYPWGGYYKYDDGGELSWFNAGVRVGMGLGLGMCLGIGLGVGILMRSYQATTGTFRRRLL